MMKKNNHPGCADIRMCAGCAKRADKHEFLRIVRTADGTVTVQPEDKICGRSAYLCKDKKCLERLRKSRRLAMLLRIDRIGDDVWNRLEELLDR